MHSKVLKIPYKTKNKLKKRSSIKVDEISQGKQIQYEPDKYALLIHFQRLHTIRYVFIREK